MVGAVRVIRFAVIVALIVSGPIAAACSCATPPTVTDAVESADLVFVGTVERIDKRWLGLAWMYVRALFGKEPDVKDYGFEVTFRTTTIWKGRGKRTVSLFTGRGGGDCGYRFEEGKTYLVYAYCRGNCYTGICTRTGERNDAATDLAVLAKLPAVALTE
jgi:hypothetical protein